MPDVTVAQAARQTTDHAIVRSTQLPALFRLTFDAQRNAGMTLDELQELIDRMYSRKDQARGVEGTFMWLMEEVGELAAALRESPKEEIAKEFADVLAWLATIANVAGIKLSDAVRQKYGQGCPGCGAMVCACSDAEKP
jgi:NTP pyrophosphatase (non-canonical NTP hydrolase)